jgi:Ricin-type beta-trefoil lectin domain
MRVALSTVFLSALFLVGTATASASTYYTLVAKHSGKCLDVAGKSLQNSANVQQWSCTGGDNQRWTLVAMGDGSYEVVGKQSGKCLDVAGQSLLNAANIQQYTCWGGQNQRWRFVSTGDGYNELVAQNSGKCLTVNAALLIDGANVFQYTCVSGAWNQRWKLLAVVAGPQPLGPSGTWTQIFGDDFNGTALDRTKWEPCWYYPTCKPMNDVSTSPANVSVSNGLLTLTLVNSSSGALIDTDPHRGSTSPGFEFQYGAF